MAKKRDFNRRKYLIFLTIIFVVIFISLLRIVWENVDVYTGQCVIEYGGGECIDNSLRIPFHNPGKEDITRVSITVPFGVETDVTLPATFNVNSPLTSDKTGVLTLVSCERGISIQNFDIEWCCANDCYNSKMLYPSNSVKIE